MAKEKHISIRQVELTGIDRAMNRIQKDTFRIEQAALDYLCSVALEEWASLEGLDSQGRLTQVEKLIHKTARNPEPKYADFDTRFPKLPSYIRRALINAATGAVSSYQTRLADYSSRKHEAMSNGRRFREKPPVFNSSNACVTMYKGQTYDRKFKTIIIKVYRQKSWQWVRVTMPSRDYRDLERALGRAKKVYCPSVVYKYHKYYLAFPLEYPCYGFADVGLCDQTVLSVDLGVNHGAVCSVVGFKGNISFRAFDPFRRERSAVNRCIATIRHVAKKSGTGQSLSAVYQKLDGLKDNYVKQLSHWIVMQAVRNEVYGIVLETFGRMKGRGRKKDRIHHWCKCKIRDYVRGMAFRYGIRVFLVNPKNTSALAYDGSGEVVRDENNFSQCTFASGKRYACDLGASYNIGARYFLRAIQKAMASEPWEQLKAEVPELATRTRCTLSTLWKVSGILDRDLRYGFVPDAA